MHLEALDNQGKKIFSRLDIFSDFYLAGGTALALQIGHRLSIDFDFFSQKIIDQSLLDKVKKIFTPNRPAVSINNPDELTIFISKVKISFIYYPFPVLFKTVKFQGIRLLSVKELALTKAYTIGRRGAYKDYVDLYFILKDNYLGLADILKLATKKYGPDFNARLFLEQLLYIDDLNDLEIDFLPKRTVKYQALLNFFQREIKKIKL